MKKQLTAQALEEKLPPWGVLVLESHHSPQFFMEWRTHDFVKIVYVLRGEGEFRFSNDAFRFAAGDVMIVPSKTANRIVDSPGSACSLYIGCLATQLLSFDSHLLARLGTQKIDGDGHFSSRIAALMRRMVYSQQRDDDDNRPLAMVADSLQLLTRIMDAKRVGQENAPTTRTDTVLTDRDRVSRYVEALETDFFEATTIDDAARSLAMPRRSFTKCFTEITGRTWLDYVHELAIQHAKSRLIETSLPIASVAFECGFNDLSTFYRQFKRRTGMAPARFRKTKLGEAAN